MRRRTLDEMMTKMGFNPGDTGPNVTELRKLVERQMQEGLVNRSAGSWAPGNHTAEDRAKAFLEVEKALASGDYEEIDPMTADD